MLLKSTFNLKTDVYNFSEKLHNDDTLFFIAAIGVCASECREYNIITKENDKIFIQSIVKDILPDYQSKEINKIPYILNPNDTLNFENLFWSMKDDISEKNAHIGKSIYEVIYKYDTIEFYPKSLSSVLRKIHFYSKIKERLYPDETIYKPEMITN